MKLIFIALLLCMAPLALIQAAPADVDSLRRVAERTPGSARAWDRLGQALARERRFEEAHAAFARALQLRPGDKGVRHHVALAYAWSGEYAEAIRRYEKLLERYSSDVELRLDYGQTLAWDGRFVAAREQYELVLSMDPQHVDALRHLGMVLAWSGGYDEALARFAQAEQYAPDNLALLRNKAEVLAWAGNQAEATGVLQKIVELAPQDEESWRRLGRIYQWQGRIGKAQSALERALALAPRKVTNYLALADLFIANHQYGQAERVLRDAIHRFPADQNLSHRLASLQAERGFDWYKLGGYVEPLLFMVLLLGVHRYMRRYRRALGRRGHTWYWVHKTMPWLAIIMLALYVLAVTGSGYRRLALAAYDVLEIMGLLVLLYVFSVMLWLLRFERPARRQVVLAIGAHPDDIEFGCGATLLRYREEGCDTHGLVLTGGERGNDGNGAADRRQEAYASAQVIALSDLQLCDFPDAGLGVHRGAIKDTIEAAVTRIQPDIVFTHTPNDLHSDHKVVFEATREAVRGACTILCYENPNTPPGFNPQYYVDTTGYLEDKITALAYHKSQSGKSYLDPEVVRGAAAFRGTQAKVKYAEAFEVVRVLEKPLLE